MRVCRRLPVNHSDEVSFNFGTLNKADSGPRGGTVSKELQLGTSKRSDPKTFRFQASKLRSAHEAICDRCCSENVEWSFGLESTHTLTRNSSRMRRSEGPIWNCGVRGGFVISVRSQRMLNREAGLVFKSQHDLLRRCSGWEILG